MKKSIFRMNWMLLLVLAGTAMLPAQAAPIKPVNFGDAMSRFHPAGRSGRRGIPVRPERQKRFDHLPARPRRRPLVPDLPLPVRRAGRSGNDQQIRKKYNLEILFVLPYDRATVEHWVSIFPEQMAVIEALEEPAREAQKDPATMRWMETSRRLFPKKFAMTKENIPTPFPILIDGERKLSEGLQLFTLFWDRSYVEQNIATIFLLDKTGQVRFKYFSQSTVDRPDAAFLLKFIERML